MGPWYRSAPLYRQAYAQMLHGNYQIGQQITLLVDGVQELPHQLCNGIRPSIQGEVPCI